MTSDALKQSAVLWIKSNTNIDTETYPLPPNVELFIEKYQQIMGLRPGISSESVPGMSQSFSGDIGEMLRTYARELFGDSALTYSDVVAHPAIDRWC